METNLNSQDTEDIQSPSATALNGNSFRRYRVAVSRYDLKKGCFEAVERSRLKDVEQDAAKDFFQPTVALLAIMIKALPSSGHSGEVEDDGERESSDLRPVLQRQSAG